MIETTDLEVTVADRFCPREDLTIFELAPLSATLPPASPGSHVLVRTPADAVRQYSIAKAGPSGSYVIGVRHLPDGRGGSASMANLRQGDRISISAPRNTFPLVEAPSYLFIAGGIGITAIRPLVEAAARAGKPTQLLYLNREPGAAVAFHDDLKALLGDRMTVHFSQRDGRLDLWPWLAKPDHTRIYCCGPEPLMDDVRRLTMHWRPSQIHFESFGTSQTLHGELRPLTIRRHRDGATFAVPEGVSVLNALRDAGMELASNCGAGTCGTCRLRLIDGLADHRDAVLEPHEHENAFMPCVSRAFGEILTLDL